MNKKQGIGPVVIVIILVVLLGGGYFFARKAGYFPETAPSDIIQPQTQTNVNTSDWKTYRSEKYGFEFKYPADWKQSAIFSDLGGYANAVSFVPAAREEQLRKSLIPDSDVGAVVIQGNVFFIKPLAEEYLYLRLEQNRDIVQTSDVVIGGMPVLYLLYSSEFDKNKFVGGSTELFIFEKKGFAIEAHYSDAKPGGELKSVLDRVLHTLIFRK